MESTNQFARFCKRLFIGVFALLLVFALARMAAPVLAQDQTSDQLEIIFFWGNGCPHCAKAKPFLEDLKTRYPYVKVTAYEVFYDADNQELYAKMADQYGVPEGGRAVPFMIIGDHYWMGFNDDIAAQIEDAVKTKGKDLSSGGSSAAAASSNSTSLTGGDSTAGESAAAPAAAPAGEKAASAASNDVITLPLIGQINLEHQSLFVSTLLISFVDGVNPCSVWVLTMLLALTLHTGSRKKVTIIGLIFLTVTAGVYALFIVGLFTVLTMVSFIGWIQMIVAAMALFFGAVNIKDYFWYKEGLSFTIDDSQKPGIYKRMRKVMDASQSFWGLAGATVVMSAGVSLVEFTCTAGFPVLWSNIVAAQKVSALTFTLLLLLYMIIYQADEMAIFFTAVYSLKASRLEEKHGRILKLIGGVLMLTLAAVMLINPSWMNYIGSSLVIFAVATAIIVLVLVLHRKVLPAFGIWIGTEAEGKSVRKANR